MADHHVKRCHMYNNGSIKARYSTQGYRRSNQISFESKSYCYWYTSSSVHKWNNAY